MSSVAATPEAVKLIERLREKHGDVVFHQSGGCCDGSAAMCLRAGDLPPGPGDVHLGEIAGAPFYVDAEQHRRWREPDFLIDVAPGPAGGFSLEEGEGVHFVSRAPS
ncbi:MAG TPA: DUF779 domain-containing protein [Solirubrobacterales bacterium]|nr:DUF779 domain-containing protein [Solirubrobacterales bacterium]